MGSFLTPLLIGKVAAVTGGTTGIGRAIVLEYVRQGCNVAVNHLGLDRDEKFRASLVDEVAQIRKDAARQGNNTTGELLEIAGDICLPATSKNLVEATVQRWGKLDVFVANAGIFKPAAFLDIEQDLLEKTINTNLTGTFYACQAAARQMVTQGKGGSIIGISSVSALQGGAMQTHYTPTKAGVLSLMQSMSIALGKHGIRCNALMPGTVKTQLSVEEISNEESRKRLEAKIPLGRYGEAHEIAGPAVFLASEQMSSFVTGAGLLADGGMYSYLQ